MIKSCTDEVDPRFVVEVAIAERPYRELRGACTRHAESARDIGLRVIDLEPEHG